jgi:hypothetical protein
MNYPNLTPGNQARSGGSLYNWDNSSQVFKEKPVQKRKVYKKRKSKYKID